MNPVLSDFESQSPNHSLNLGVPMREREMHSPWEDQGDFLKKVVLDMALEEVGFRYGAGKRVFQILRISGPGEGAWEARGSVRRFQDGVKGIMERLKVGKLKLLR